jgi:phosphoribosylglycinamide formyltransferase-1
MRDATMPRTIRLAALISGGGTTLQNLIDRIGAGTLDATIVGVVSSRADAAGVERSRGANLPVRVVSSRSPRFADEVWSAVRGFAPDLVCFAGWLHLVPIPPDFHHRVLNIHPALLPSFGGKGMYGRRVHEAVLAAGVKVSGCTVHFADETYDTGPILVQKCVPVNDDDNPETLAARVFEAECEAYPEAIRLLASGKIRVEGKRALISDESGR